MSSRIAAAAILLMMVVTGALVFGQQNNDPIPQSNSTDVKFTLETVGGRTEFQIGELIPIQISYSSESSQTYPNLSLVPSRRLWAWKEGTFLVEPSTGWSDPFQADIAEEGMYFTDRLQSGPSVAISEMAGSQPQSRPESPLVISRELNEFVRFDEPGRYRIRLAGTFGRAERIVSSGLAITILPASPFWQRQVLEQGRQAIAVLTSESGMRLRGQAATQYRSLFEALCFLGTADAARALLSDGIDATRCLMGSPNRVVAVEEMRSLLANPAYAPPDPDRFLKKMILIMRDLKAPWAEGARNYWEADEGSVQEIHKDLLAAIPRKRPESRGATLQVLLSLPGHFVTKEPFPPEESGLIASYFGDLPRSAQAYVLTSLWDRLPGPSMLPIVREYARREFGEFRTSLAADDALRLNGSALQRWHEIAPVEARPYVLQEIVRPLPRFSSKLLGMLPDAVLPEQEEEIARHFDAVQGLPQYQANAASLVYRYATVASLSRVLLVIDTNLGKWPCEIQSPALAYLLRVAPEAARPRLEKAITASRELTGACRRYVFVQIGDLQPSPVLEDLAVAALDDSDPQLAANAATYLSDHGSAAAEARLWDRLERWSAQWQNSDDQRIYQSQQPNRNPAIAARRDLGTALVRALLEGHSWLASIDELIKLRPLAVDLEIQGSIDTRISALWPPRRFDVLYYRVQDLTPRYDLLDYSIHREPIQFSVMGYKCQSLAALKEKLSQFPVGSTFSLRNILQAVDESVFEELRVFLRSYGYFLAD